jgi:antitoxin component of MazEF toxin-antitoxin module
MPFYRVKEYKISAKGLRGAAITIPNTVLRDLGAKTGEKISIYRGTIDGLPVAVLAKVDTAELAAEAQE